MECSEEGGGIFYIACGNAAPFFESKESVFDKMSKGIELFVKVSLLFSVFSGRNDELHARFPCRMKHILCVIGLVCNQPACVYSFNKFNSLRTVMCGTIRNKYS